MKPQLKRQAPTQRLSVWRLTAYALITVPLATAGLPVAILLAPLYTDHVGLGFTVVGVALMATRLLDIVVDPLVGRLSDATTSRFGRRVPWILVGIPIMMMGTWKAFVPAADATGWSLFLWLSSFYVGWALITVPYGAWGAELSDDYHERSRIAGARELWSVFGLLFAVTLPLFAGPPELKTGGSSSELETLTIAADVTALGWATIVLLPITAAALVLLVPISRVSVSAAGWSRGVVRDLARNRPFLLLLGATFFAGLASGMNQTTVIHYYRHRAGLGDSSDVMIFVFFGAAVLGALFWVWLARRMPKHHVVAWSSLLNLAFTTGILLVPKGDILGFLIIQIGSGIAYAGPLILGASMAADVIDLDWLRSGMQRSAIFIAIWGIGKKLSEAVGVGIALPTMEAMGYSAHTASSDASQWALITVNVILPSVFALIAIPFILVYPITEKHQKVIRRAIERRLARRATREIPTEEECDFSALEQQLSGSKS